MRKVPRSPATTLLVLLAVSLFPSLTVAQTVLPPLSRETPLSRVVYELYLAEIEANDGFRKRHR